jgi:cell division transport system ATP-binding protein
MIRFSHVVKEYPRTGLALQDVTFRVNKGEFAFLTGPSGAGKSTILRLVIVEETPTAGEVRVSGSLTSGLPRAEIPRLRRKIGVVFQDFRLLDHLSAIDNVALPLRIAGARESEVQTNVRELLTWVGLGAHLHALPATLSGGQQQRIAIARAVVSRPSLLLADEPTGNVDDRIGVRLMYLFEELNRLGTTVVIATHNEALVRRFPHPQLRIAENRVVRVDATNDPAPPEATADDAAAEA